MPALAKLLHSRAAVSGSNAAGDGVLRICVRLGADVIVKEVEYFDLGREVVSDGRVLWIRALHGEMSPRGKISWTFHRLLFRVDMLELFPYYCLTSFICCGQNILHRVIIRCCNTLDSINQGCEDCFLSNPHSAIYGGSPSAVSICLALRL